ncbi:MAG: hypothetical protein COT14_04060 [Candidatus Diapherotrites archaeon CG08_land_8_20_14_0_20_30_16]|nr:MAG: hypothetical protein COT14_04060 [Candidatus Diapherotrites archaeon CG08_land_8_20_14_0_20_30_16]
MIRLLDNCIAFRLLLFLTANVGQKYSINELARLNKISPRAAEINCKYLFNEELLLKEVVGKSHLYFINTENELTKLFKKIAFPYLFLSKESNEFFSKNEDGIISVYLYGSCASGTYNDKSDVDIFILSTNELSNESLSEIRVFCQDKIFDRKLQLTCYTLSSFRKMIKSGNPFVNEVAKGVKLFGNKI